MRGHRNIHFAALGLAISLATTPIFAKSIKLEFGDAKRAKLEAASRVLELLNTPTFAVGQFTDQSDLIDRNSLTSFGSDTTYHSNTFSKCLKWVSTTLCERWLDPYVAEHGLGGGSEKSPLEGIASVWESLKKDIDASQVGSGNVQYAMWSVKARNGKSILKVDDPVRSKALDPEALADWRLLPEVEQQVIEIGDRTSEQAIRQMVKAEEGEEDQTMPDLASLRGGAASLTRALRNRLLRNVGEARVSQPGIEFELNEEISTCEDYLANADKFEQAAETPGAIPLPLRDLETRINPDPQKRYELCKQVIAASIYQVNPDVKGGKVSLGDPNEERYDAAMNRINIAMIDNVGLDPFSQPKPEEAVIRKEDVTQNIATYEDGGAEYYDQGLTNADQIKLYNANLQQAAINMKAVAALAPDEIPDTSERILASQIEIGSKRIDQISGLTDQMKEDLKDTKLSETTLYSTTGVRSSDPDDESIEISPSQLTITTLGN